MLEPSVGGENGQHGLGYNKRKGQQIYGSTIVRGYVVADTTSDGLRCEARIVDGGYYTMFNLRSGVSGLTVQEYVDCEALLLQVFDCP